MAGGEGTQKAGPASEHDTVSDLDTARPIGQWQMATFLPPACQQQLLTSIALLVWEPWFEAAKAAAANGRPAPSPEEVAAATHVFFDDFFSMKVLEQAYDIRRMLGSSGAFEQQALEEGTASQEDKARTFPQLPGSHLALQSPALEFTKMVCHLASLDPLLNNRVLRMRRNVLKMLDVPEFSTDAKFVQPCMTYVLPDVVCAFCGQCRDLDLCRDADEEHKWTCEVCSSPYDEEAIECRLIEIVQQRSLAFQLQDLECKKCRSVKRRDLESRCSRCSGEFALRQPSLALSTFASIARFYDMPLLAETVEWLSAA